MRNIGLRPIVQRPDVEVLELAGARIWFWWLSQRRLQARLYDLMSMDLQATHQHFIGLGLAPTPIETVSDNHERFWFETRRSLISFFSNHVSGQPVEHRREKHARRHGDNGPYTAGLRIVRNLGVVAALRCARAPSWGTSSAACINVRRQHQPLHQLASGRGPTPIAHVRARGAAGRQTPSLRCTTTPPN